MSIADKITSITNHLTDDYVGIANLGVDLTNVDKNIQNIKSCLDGIYNDYPKTEYGEDLNVSLSNTKKGKMQIIPEGNNTQESINGYQLLNVVDGTYASSHGTITAVASGGEITLNGTATSGTEIISIPFPYTFLANTSYTISANNPQVATGIYDVMLRFDDNINPFALSSINTTSTYTPTENKSATRFTIRIENGASVSNYKLKPMVEIGSTAHTWEEYVGGTKSPNPSYQQYINRATGNNKFLFNGSNFFSSAIELGTLSNANGSTASETRAVRSKDFIPVAPNTRYCVANDMGYACYLYEYDKNQKFLKFTSSNTQFSFVTMEQTRYVKFRTVASRTENDTNVKYMLNLGQTPLTWEAYTGEVLPLNLSSKNLFTGLVKGKVVDAITGVETTNANGSVSDFIKVDFINNSNYYLSGLTNTLNSFVAGYNKYGVFVGRTGGGARTGLQMAGTSFTQGTPQGTGKVEFIRVVQQWVSGNTGTIDDIDNLQVQLEVGNSATTYEPYWNYDLNGTDTYKDQLFKNVPINPLYNSELTLGSWYKLNKIEEIKLKDISFTLSTTFTNVVRARGNLSPKSISTPNGLCNAFTFLAIYSSDEEHFYIQDTALWLFINKSRLDAITDKGINDFIDANNFYAMGVLDTQTYTEITQTSLINQLEAIDSKQSYAGTTIISSIYEDDNAPITVKTRALKGE